MQGAGKKRSRGQQSCPSEKDFFIFYFKIKSEKVILDIHFMFSKVGSVIFDKVTRKPMNLV